MKDSAG